jgi:2'-5' RNA ligase
MDAFPSINCPQIIWVGIDEGKEIIVEMNHKMEDKLSSLGFKKERKRFNPHLTVGRVKSLKGFSELTKRIAIIETPVERMVISDINIMKSQLNPQGAIHSVLEKIALQ